MSLSLYWNFDKSVSTIVSTTSSTIFSMKTVSTSVKPKSKNLRYTLDFIGQN